MNRFYFVGTPIFWSISIICIPLLYIVLFEWNPLVWIGKYQFLLRRWWESWSIFGSEEQKYLYLTRTMLTMEFLKVEWVVFWIFSWSMISFLIGKSQTLQWGFEPRPCYSRIFVGGGSGIWTVVLIGFSWEYDGVHWLVVLS